MVTLWYGPPSRQPIRYWYTVALPSIWLAVMVCLWLVVWEDGSVVAVVAGFPGDLLPAAFGLNGLSFALAQIVGGIPIMAAVGLLQDYLRVPPVWTWAYLAGAVTGALISLAGIGQLVADTLFWGCIGLYVVSVILCLVSGAIQLRRWLAHRVMCKGS